MHCQQLLIHSRSEAMTKGNKLLSELRMMLQSNADPERKIGQERYFKGTIRSHGIPMPVVLKIGRTYLQKLKPASKEDIFQSCEDLWRSGNFEESIIACHWSRYPHKNYTAGDMKIFERWVSKYVGNWASCDTFCNHTVAMLLERFPGQVGELKKWAKSKNRWMRRAAAVSLIVPAKKGMFTGNILDIASILLEDEDDMVQKGYGWLLKVAWEAQPAALYAFVSAHKARMPRTALRYAIEKWPASQRRAALAA
jgi:3-methyladenine DNA glycosylase AlkD